MATSFELKGILKKVKTKKTEKHPDYEGSIRTGGKLYYIAAWDCFSEKKQFNYISLSLTEVNEYDEDEPFK